jgi:5,10-methylenetetrahydromethanopterin reductase
VEIACCFAPSAATPEHIALAEELGYSRAWCYDSPAIYADAFMTLAVAASRTRRIRLGVGVITPHLRHLVANAGSVALLATLAPERVDVGVGAGFTSAVLIGRGPSRWMDVEAYVVGLRALLRGEQIEWDGATVQLLHGHAAGVRVPTEVPVWVAAHGPRGHDVGMRVADGIITNPRHGADPLPTMARHGVLFTGTVLEDGETLDSARVRAAAGPGAALALHLGEGGPLAGTPEAAGFAAAAAAVPTHRRDLAVHGMHLIDVSPLDDPFLTPDVIARGTVSGTRVQIAAALDELEREGATVAFYQPAGPDIPRELRAFAEAAALRTATLSPVGDS